MTRLNMALRALLVLLACLPGMAWAWGTLILIEATPAADKLAIGASYWVVPRSPDGQHNSHALTPAIDYYRHDGWFASTEMGVGFNASNIDSWQAGVRLWPQFGRAGQDATFEQPRLGPRLQKQGFANVMLGEIALLQSALSYGSGRNQNGVQTELGITSGIPWQSGMLGIGLAATYGNRAYRRDYTHVDACGWSDWSWTVNVDQKLGSSWHADAQLQRVTIVRSGAMTDISQTTWHPSALLVSLWRDW